MVCEFGESDMPAMVKSTVGAILSGSGAGSSESEEQENSIKIEKRQDSLVWLNSFWHYIIPKSKLFKNKINHITLKSEKIR